MEDSPEDLPKPPRRTAARPFFSPRPNSGEGTTGPLELSRRRAAQLFTPPAASAPVADKAPQPIVDSVDEHSSEITSSAADGATEMVADAPADPVVADTAADAPSSDIEHDVDFEGDWTPAPMVAPERTLDAESLRASNLSDDDRLHIEQYEHEDIELTAAASNVPDEHAIEVIGYDDANSLLKATTSVGETPQVDGLRLESTEFSFEEAAVTPRMNVDSFWASEPFAKIELPEVEAAALPVADETESTIDEETAGEGESTLALERFGTEPTIDEQPFEWADDPSTTISHAQAALEPEPEHDPEPAREPSPMLADIAPPWMSRLTPASVQSLEELKESEPWDLTPSHGLEAIPEQPRASAAPAGHDVADALERIAARVRDGELDVPAGADLSDEAALSAVLTALLRMRR
jgi:hypothetical protein